MHTWKFWWITQIPLITTFLSLFRAITNAHLHCQQWTQAILSAGYRSLIWPIYHSKHCKLTSCCLVHKFKWFILCWVFTILHSKCNVKVNSYLQTCSSHVLIMRLVVIFKKVSHLALQMYIVLTVLILFAFVLVCWLKCMSFPIIDSDI